MPLSAEKIARVRQSFDALGPLHEPTSMQFYESLFAREPELRKLFREDLKGQGMRFMNTLGLLLADMEHPGKASVNYAELGKLHRVLGIRQSHFEPMKEALIETLTARLGDALTPSLEAAWREAFDTFSAKLIEEGDIPA